MTHHLRVSEPSPGVVAFYDGRTPGYRFAAEPNWVDDGALEFGIASYAILDGEEALVYDTGVSVEHGEFVREELRRRGASRFTVVLSHSHLDHVAGTEAFAGAEVIANERTAERLRGKRAAIEAGTLEGPPAIAPLVLPTRTFSGSESLVIGDVRVDPDQIGGGGHPAGLNAATQAYIRLLQRMPSEPELREVPLRQLIAEPLAAGWVTWFEACEPLHRQNVKTVLTFAERP